MAMGGFGGPIGNVLQRQIEDPVEREKRLTSLLSDDAKEKINTYQGQQPAMNGMQSGPFSIMDYLPAPTLETPEYQALEQEVPTYQPVDMSDFDRSPGYDFQLSRGREAIERGAAARGGLLSGGTLKSLTEFGQGLAAQDYGQEYARRAGEQQRQYENQKFGYQSAYNEREAKQKADSMRFLSQYQKQIDDYTREQSARGQQLNLLGSLMGLQAYQPQYPGASTTALQQDIGAAQAQQSQAIGQGIGGGVQNLGNALAFMYMGGKGADPTPEDTDTFYPWANK